MSKIRWQDSDVDIFFYGLDEREAEVKLQVETG